MSNNKKINQTNYTESVPKVKSNLFEDKKNWDNTGIYQTSESFPPRGSFINIPDETLFGYNEELLNNIVEDKNKNIGSDLYKKNRDCF